MRRSPARRRRGTFVHELFQGKLVSETRCLQCETVTNREEAFKDLSLEIEQNSSITACLRNFRRAGSSLQEGTALRRHCLGRSSSCSSCSSTTRPCLACTTAIAVIGALVSVLV